ncbi:TadE/TadG family type IV pilus assembly protein [Tepidiforma flava]|uniref:TadE/TadG family type IV pilus assembly protein n=1 Tax=Tepidiforma flava TaxID=3004094 RepID=A0ABY7M7H8_9CHLR|nr:TadE/TadG family type IV pilus assembly protein [Tepidiforma flava]WBL35583.1 TadE/TadG family type IV pilus assembly protein [Tepidiforma flava]
MTEAAEEPRGAGMEEPGAPRRSALRRLLRRFRETETGQALVEFTMILPLFVLLFMSMVEFGRAFHTWLLITNAAREGARIAAVQSDLSTVQTRIYDSFCANYPSQCNIDPSRVTITTANVQGSRGSMVQVDVAYNFQWVTPIGNIVNLVSGGNLANLTIRSHASMRLE